MNKRILITGGTGMIGRRLIDDLCGHGAYVKILTRNPEKVRKTFPKHFALEALEYSKVRDAEELARTVSEVDAVINLAGANIGDKRWNKQRKNLIYSSRIEVTELIADAIELAESKPECLISASGIGFYGDCGDEILTEEDHSGSDFLAKVCKDWENEAMRALAFGVRVVTVRTGVVFDRSEGAFPKLLQSFKFMFGTVLGSGKQWMSWIHLNDIVKVYSSAIINAGITGPVNATAPGPVKNRDLTVMIGKKLNRNLVIPAPEFALKLALGEMSETILGSQRAIPSKLLSRGFVFEFPDIDSALDDLLNLK